MRSSLSPCWGWGTPEDERICPLRCATGPPPASLLRAPKQQLLSGKTGHGHAATSPRSGPWRLACLRPRWHRRAEHRTALSNTAASGLFGPWRKRPASAQQALWPSKGSHTFGSLGPAHHCVKEKFYPFDRLIYHAVSSIILLQPKHLLLHSCVHVTSLV